MHSDVFMLCFISEISYLINKKTIYLYAVSNYFKIFVFILDKALYYIYSCRDEGIFNVYQGHIVLMFVSDFVNWYMALVLMEENWV